MTIYKNFEIKVAEKRRDGGRIVISTGGFDRDNDRVSPAGGRFESYLKNPVVQWGHNYSDPWATIGKTNTFEINADNIVADFTLRPPANDADPQNIINLLWEGEWIRTASIGFIPSSATPNDKGGRDFADWSLLEWSLCPLPANADALRLAVKGYDAEAKTVTESAIETKKGRVLSAVNEQRLRGAANMILEVLDQVATPQPEEEPIEESVKTVADGDFVRLAEALGGYLDGVKEVYKNG